MRTYMYVYVINNLRNCNNTNDQYFELEKITELSFFSNGNGQ